MPLLAELELSDFRSYTRRKFVFSGKDVALTGPNGVGKTNVLEAIAFLSVLRSFRGATSRELVRLGAAGFALGGKLDLGGHFENLGVREHLSGGRELLIGQAKVRRASDFIHEFRAAVFSPEDRAIAAGSSGSRRRFFDMLISTLDAGYLAALGNYNRALIQRNKALKLKSPTAGAFEPELAACSPVIVKIRTDYAEAIAREVNRLLAGKGEFAIRHRCDCVGDEAEQRRKLAADRPREYQRGATLSGPQLDEFDFMFNGRKLRGFGSTGQIRLITLLVKLAGYRLMRSRATEPVIVLADDVPGELDRAGLELFLETIQSADQRFFTFTEKPGLPGFDNCETIAISGDGSA